MIFNNAAEFSEYIEGLASENKQTLIETMIQYSENNDVEFDSLPKYLSKSLKDKLRFEYEQLGYIKNSAAIPLEQDQLPR